jgi:hypothetical protein
MVSVVTGEKLRIIWPGARETISGPSEFSAEALPLMSLLLRGQMLDALLAEVERMSNTPLPPQQRAERIKVLEEEVDQLQRVEEVLVTREGAERSTQLRASGRAWRAGGRRARRSRRVTPDQQRESKGDAASAFANCGDTVAYVGGR